jgi:uncharacterized protein involved in response to NO
MTMMNTEDSSRRLSFRFFSAEPFRIFFPAGTLAGIAGVALWPLYFTGLAQFYPGLGHARIMACGFFGGFIFGFLGTAMPRMLDAKPLRTLEVFPLLLIHAAMVLAFALGRIQWGDALFLALLAGFVCPLLLRAWQTKVLPPPGFVLVALALICVAAGTVLALVTDRFELETFWINLQRLLSSQAFILLPILGIGPFILPRFFGMPASHDLPDSAAATRSWRSKALLALATGLLIITTFFLEAKNSLHTAYALRFAAVLGYLALEIPFHRGPGSTTAPAVAIYIALAALLAGFLAVAIFPAHRVSLLHLTLVGGFAVITFIVATRVVFGHSGNLSRLKARNRWLYVAIGLMLFGMTTRISADFWPKVLVSHYIYGALVWIAGVVLWAVGVLPKVLVADTEN